MDVLVLVMGTRGDLELFLQLGCELKRRGHSVTVATSPFFEDRVRAAGLASLGVGAGTQAELVGVLRSLASIPDARARVGAYFQRWVAPQLKMSMDRIKTALARADYVINNLKSVFSRGATVIPGADLIYEPPGRIEDLAKHMPRRIPVEGAILQLVALNKRLVDPGDRWGDRYHFSGFWQGAEAASFEPPAALERFLAAGRPPVVLTMGSMVMFDARRLLRTFTLALEQAGERGVVVGGWSGIDAAEPLPEFVYPMNDVPYEWLLPRAACVVHHGGCGTVAATLRAGRPSILLPLITSQSHFAAILQREFLAAATFEADALEPGALAAAIQQAVGDPRHEQSARVWQQRVLADLGVVASTDRIEQHAAERGLS